MNEAELRNILDVAARQLEKHAADPQADLRTMVKQMRQTADLVEAEIKEAGKPQAE